mmetsp:Transcript_90206/g.160670  ORF Transcript_90206/g.160670 Transcript_90206/m.160670 type:complete len:238 (-) Transcript_90206:79-792(-)
MSGFFRGTNTDQVKHVNAEQKLIKQLTKDKKFPEHYSKKVDMSKVSMDVMKPWITKRITELLGFEDDIVVDFCVAQLHEPGEKGMDPKLLQVNMTGFMERKAAPFCSELWTHLLSAQDSPVGVPREFIDQKKEELKQKKEEAERVQEELKRRRQDLEDAAKADREAEKAKTSDRSRRDDDRGRGRDDDRGRGRDREDDRRDDRRGRGREERRRQREESGSESPQPRKRDKKSFKWED